MRAPFRVVMITGASSGLGARLAALYAGPDVALGLIGRNPERLESVAAVCKEAGSIVRVAAIDIADKAKMARWSIAFDSEHPVELIIANAGISAGVDRDGVYEPTAVTVEQIRVNLLGTVHTLAPLLPALCRRRRGQIALIASAAALRGLPYSPGYSASKAGVRAYGEALRPLLEERGVGVTVVCPGFFTSRMTDRWEGPTPFLVSGEEAARRIKRGIDTARRRIAFPLPLALALRFCDLAPAAVTDAILRRFRFHIRAQ